MNTQQKEIGLVVECLPNLEFRVQRADGSIIRCYVAGKLKQNKIKIGLNDKVEFVSDQYGHIGRITWRK